MYLFQELFHFCFSQHPNHPQPIMWLRQYKMKTKFILAIIAVALVAAALVGVSAAQYVGTQNTTNPTLTQGVPPCANASGVVPPYCINATTGEPYCYNNGIAQATATTATQRLLRRRRLQRLRHEPKHKTKTRTNTAGA